MGHLDPAAAVTAATAASTTAVATASAAAARARCNYHRGYWTFILPHLEDFLEMSLLMGATAVMKRRRRLGAPVPTPAVVREREPMGVSAGCSCKGLARNIQHSTSVVAAVQPQLRNSQVGGLTLCEMPHTTAAVCVLIITRGLGVYDLRKPSDALETQHTPHYTFVSKGAVRDLSWVVMSTTATLPRWPLSGKRCC